MKVLQKQLWVVLQLCWLTTYRLAATAATDPITPPDVDLTAAPWLSPPTHPPAYRGLHTDLPGLLRAQSVNNTITWTVFTKPWVALLLNWVFALVTYGDVRSYMVVTVDPHSLALCIQLNLPCFDASAKVPAEVRDGISPDTELDLGSPVAWGLMKWKTDFLKELLDLGYDVHYSDVDTVFVKRAYPSYRRLLMLFKSDIAMMRELFMENVVNTGNYFMQNSAETRRLLSHWSADTSARQAMRSDQDYLHHLKGSQWKVCYSGYNCTRVSRENMTPLLGYPEQMTGWWGEQCPQEYHFWKCADHAVHIHYMCLSGGGAEKMLWMKNHNLWFTDNITTIEGLRAFNAAGHEFLPCRDTLAWRWWSHELAYGQLWKRRR